MLNAESIIEQLKMAIKHDSLVLPTLPEVAIKARDAANDQEASVSSLTKVIEVDPALTARLIKVANSPMYRGATTTNDLKSAINRLGIRTTASLVTSLAMEQMFHAKTKFVDLKIRAIWNNATEVAGIAHVLCKNFTTLKPEQATLCGLVHEIGALPILTFTEKNEDMMEHNDFVDTLIGKVAPKLGEMILNQWDFPKELIQSPQVMSLVVKSSPGKVNYMDVLVAAKMKSLLNTDHPYAGFPWSEVPAIVKLGIDTSEDGNEIEDLSEDMEAAANFLR